MEKAATSPFTVDTGGACFLCLQKNSELEEGDMEETRSSNYSRRLSLKPLSRFLGTSLKLRSIITSTSVPLPNLNCTEALVELCDGCSTLMEEFRYLHFQYELNKMGLHFCVGRIKEIMEAANSGEAINQFHRRMREISNPAELISVGIADSLRRETLSKCKSRDEFPKIRVPKLEAPSKEMKRSRGALKKNRMSKGCSQISTGRNNNSIRFRRRQLYKPSKHQKNFPDRQIIHFDKLPSGKYECRVCGEVLRSSSHLKFHRSKHARSQHQTNQPLASSSDLTQQSEIAFTAPQASKPISDHVPIVIKLESDDEDEELPQPCRMVTDADGHGPPEPNYFDNASDFLQVTLQESPGPSMTYPASDLHLAPVGVPIVTQEEAQGMLRNITEPVAVCNQCGQVFPNQSALRTHAVKSHNAKEKAFACCFCSKTLASRKSLIAHFLRTHKDKLFTAFKKPTTTDDQFSAAIRTILQLMIHSNQKDCKLCQKSYVSGMDCQSHVIRTHFNEVAKVLVELQRDN